MGTVRDSREAYTIPAGGRLGQWGRRSRTGRLRLTIAARATIGAPAVYLQTAGPPQCRCVLALPRRYITTDVQRPAPLVVETAAPVLEAWIGPDPWISAGVSGVVDLRLEEVSAQEPIASSSAVVLLGSRLAQPADGSFRALSPIVGPGPWAGGAAGAEALQPDPAPRVYLEYELPAAPAWGQVSARWGRGNWPAQTVAGQVTYTLPGVPGPGRHPLQPPGASDYLAREWGGAAGVIELAVDPGVGVALDLAAYQTTPAGRLL